MNLLKPRSCSLFLERNDFFVLDEIENACPGLLVNLLALFKPPIVQETGSSCELSEQLSLTVSGVKTKSKSLFQKHGGMLNLVCEKVNRFKTWKNVCFCNACAFGLCYQISTTFIHKTNPQRSKDHFLKCLSGFQCDLRGDGGGTKSCTSSHQLSPETTDFQTCEFSKRSFLPSYSKKRYPSIRQALWGDNLWSPSYFAGSCGGAPISVIRQYIENQNAP